MMSVRELITQAEDDMTEAYILLGRAKSRIEEAGVSSGISEIRGQLKHEIAAAKNVQKLARELEKVLS